MIKDITQSGAFVQVSSLPYSPPNVYNSAQGAGQVRYNTSAQQMEVYDGVVWISITQTATVGLTMPAEDAIRWARDKMVEEAELKERMNNHPGLRDSWEKFQIMDILCKEENV